MNIFVLSRQARRAAALHSDAHVVKMLLESLQILSTALSLHSQPAPYLPTHKKHPCVIWAAAHRPNFQWLLDLALALADEHKSRYPASTEHKCAPLVRALAERDLSFLPDHPDPDLLAELGNRARVIDQPEGCLFGVVVGPSTKASVVAAYRSIYAQKRTRGQKMRWGKQDEPPAQLAFAFLEPELECGPAPPTKRAQRRGRLPPRETAALQLPANGLTAGHAACGRL